MDIVTWEGIDRIKLKADALVIQLQWSYSNLGEERLKVSRNLTIVKIIIKTHESLFQIPEHWLC